MNGLKAILWKDIVREIRTRELLSSTAAFSIVLVVLFNFSINITSENAGFIIPSLYWISILFVGTLGLSRSFAVEKENSAITGILLSPVDRSLIYISKVTGNLIFIVLLQLFLILLFFFLFNVNFTGSILHLLVIVLLGGFGLSAVGTLFSTLAVNTKLREVLLPIIIFPIIIPVVLNSIKATTIILSGGVYGDISAYIKLLVCFDIIFFVAGAVVYEFVVEES